MISEWATDVGSRTFKGMGREMRERGGDGGDGGDGGGAGGAGGAVAVVVDAGMSVVSGGMPVWDNDRGVWRRSCDDDVLRADVC